MGKIRKILIAATIFLIPAYLVRFTVSGVPTNILEILILITFFISLLFGNKLDWKNFYKENKIYVFCIILIFAGLLISTLVNENYRTGFGIIKGWFAIPLMLAFVLIKEFKTGGEVKKALKWLYLGVFLVALVSLDYYFSGNLTYDGRLKAFYLSPNHLAMYLSPAIIIGLLLVQNQKSKISAKGAVPAGRQGSASGEKNKTEKIKSYTIFSVYIISLLIILSSLYLTYSYAAWIAVIVSLVIIKFIKSKKVSKKTALVGLIVLLLIITSQWSTEKLEDLKNYSRSSLESRIMIWKSAVRILEDNPIWGIGPGNFQVKYLEYQEYFPPYLEWAVPQPHNVYLAFWLESGILGLTGFLILLIVWIKKMLELAKKKQDFSSWLTLPLLGIMFYILLHGLVDTQYWKNDLAMVFWVMISMGIILQQSNINGVQSPIDSIDKK